MIPPEAIQQFADNQKKLLRQTYDDAWQDGVGAYEPDPDPDQQPSVPLAVAALGLGGAALLALRRLYNYVAPVHPDPVLRAAALAPSYGGVNTMVGELATFASQQLADDTQTFADALQQWVDDNAFRLDNGDSVAWAGEQAGYGEAADTDGQLLEWDDEGDDRVCDSCAVLGDMPPQALADWPCQPGDGSTECNVGCRCSLRASDIQLVPGDTYTPPLTGDQENLVGALANTRADALNSMMPDASYLD